MFRVLFTILFLAAVCAANAIAQKKPTSQTQERGLKVLATDEETGKEVELYGDSWALLVGVNKYKNVTPLNYAVADAESIRTMLIRKYAFRPNRITMLTDAKATKKGIMDAFATLLNSAPNDRVLVFYAGHGTQTDLPGGGEMGYLIPVDGKTKTKSDLYSTCISMEELRNISRQIPAKHALVLVDACYGGLAATTTRSLSIETKLYVQKIAVANSRQIITAGGRGEVAVEKADWGHSAFTKALLDGLGKELADLDGNNLITASELASYLRPKVTALSELKQTPQFKSFTDDEGDFMFVLGGRPIKITKPPQVETARTRDDQQFEQQSGVSIEPRPLVRDIKFSGMLALPMGDFGSTASTGNPGLAKTGFGFTAEYTMDLANNFGFTAGGGVGFHATDAASLLDTVLLGVTTQASSWSLVWATIGPSGYFRIGEHNRIHATGYLGVLWATLPEVKITGPGISGPTLEISRVSSTASAVAYGFGLGFVFADKFDVGMRMLFSEPEYNATLNIIGLDPAYDGTYRSPLKRPVSVLSFEFAYRLGL